ncbi:major vault protein-like [Syngnathus acus]|uniref:major vault protein-like n=1 Tax=Syngnathus acus TaxID=161584 RepID=UPI001885CCC8|nr:major vault protein-like [Syngnathus acus]
MSSCPGKRVHSLPGLCIHPGTGPSRAPPPEDPMSQIPPNHYIHVLNQNTCVARVEIGPQTYRCVDNERVLFAPVPLVMVPPRHYCVVKLKDADLDIRLTGDLFPLHPGEKIQQDVTPLQVVHPNTALRLQALINFMDGTERRVAGTEWLFEGPGTYIPRKEVVVLETIEATVIGENQPIRLRARQEGVDRRGVIRVTGEEWLVRKAGVYLPGAHEEVIDIVNAFLPTDKIIRIPPDHYIHVLDQNTCIARVEIGPQTYHCLDNERVLFAPVPMVMVPPCHYCVVELKHADLDIRLTGNPFPLHPGEKIQQDVTPLQVVHPNTALRLQALIDFMDGEEWREAGTEWLFEGPGMYIPRKEMVVLETIEATVIGENQPIRLRARQEGVDRRGVLRVTGEEWLVRKAGVYLPGAHEEVIDIVNAFLPTDKVRFSRACRVQT